MAYFLDISKPASKDAESQEKINCLTNKIGNGEMIKRVRTKENFQLLEHIIHDMHTKYTVILKEKQSSRDAFNYGKKIGGKDLKRILDKSKEDIDSFLGLSWEEKPSIAKGGILTIDKYTKGIWYDYIAGVGLLGAGLAGVVFAPEWLLFNFLGAATGIWALSLARKSHKYLNSYDCYYHVRCNKIRIKLKPEYFFDREVGIKPIVDHEYAHFVLSNSLLKDIPSNKKRFNVFEEGFAEGIEEAIGAEHHKGTGNTAYILPVLNAYFNLLKYVYLDTANKCSFKASGALYREGIINRGRTAAYFPDGSSNVFHAYGKALFKILEHNHGLGIYRKTVNNDLSFL